MDCNFYMPTEIISGEGCVKAHPERFRRLGRRCLIVTSKTGAKKSGALDDCTAALDAAGIPWTVFDQITQNPRLSDCQRGGEAARAFGADFLVGIGGGSPLDAAKAIAVFAANHIPAMAVFDKNWPNRALPFALIGTTAGTGSEITPFAIMTIDETGRKQSFSREDTYAALAFCDPRYTWSLPKDFTVSTALDALSHAIEGYFGAKANLLSDAAALAAIRQIYPVLLQIETLEAEQITPRQREALYYGSLAAGMTLNHCSTCFCHTMGYFLTEQYGIPHGRACAVYLPAYVRRGVEHLPHKVPPFRQALDCDPERFCQDLVRWNDAAFPCLAPEQIEALLPRWEGARHFQNSPGGYTLSDARQLLSQLFSGEN